MSVLDLFKLEGKVAIVTGGGRSLGQQSAFALAEAGADVAVCDLDEESAAETCKAIIALGRRASYSVTNVTLPEQIARFLEKTVSDLGPIDILVNNAAMPSLGLSLEQIPLDDWRRSMDTNLSSLFYVTQPVATQMITRGQGGVIINIASISGMIINNIFPRHNVEYCTAKAAVAHLTKGMASEWAQYGIRANAIAPGNIRTAQTAASAKFPEIVERITNQTPMKRYGRIDELKGTVVYLASEASSFMTGSVVVVDGGITIW